MIVTNTTHLVAAVVDDEVHDQLHASLVAGIFDLLPVVKCAVSGVNILIVRDVVAHVGLGGLVHRREPDDVDAKLMEVGDLGQDSLERPMAVRGMVSERSLGISTDIAIVTVLLRRQLTG